MSKIFGPIAQNGYVVPDLDQAIAHWATSLGVGPWFEMDTSIFKEMVYRGEPTSMSVRIALANSGDLQIELIQPLDDEPSPYRDFLTATGGRGGLQHISSWPVKEVFDALLATHPVAFSGRGGGTRFAYFEQALDFGTMMEIADLTDGTRAYFEEIKAAANRWDGKEARAS
jgi:hypothetical protein